MPWVFAKKMNIALLLISSLLSAIFLWIWYTQYYQWIDCFNELGRCFNPNDSVVYTDSSFVWVIPAVIFLGLSIIILFKLLKKR